LEAKKLFAFRGCFLPQSTHRKRRGADRSWNSNLMASSGGRNIVESFATVGKCLHRMSAQAIAGRVFALVAVGYEC